MLLCIDLHARFEDLQTSQRRSCTVITDGSVLPSTFYISGEMCPLLTGSQRQRVSCSSRGCCGVLMGSPALNERVVIGKWLLTLSVQVLGSNTIFWLILHDIVIEVILQKKRHIYCWTIKASLPALKRIRNGGRGENMSWCLELRNTPLAVLVFSSSTFLWFSVMKIIPVSSR